MTSNPILRVLSTFSGRGIRALLMGGQACILYGGAEFSRDVDWAIDPSDENLTAIRLALASIPAAPIFLPPLAREALVRGHACHFRCTAPDAGRLRIDLLARMRGVDPFPDLWGRRAEVEVPGAGRLPVLSLPDLVKSKKTQRDKDWPMIRRLVEADILRQASSEPAEVVRFWLEECRTPLLLLDLVARHCEIARGLSWARPVLQAAASGDGDLCARLLAAEERLERERDQAYWAPLRRELEQLRFESRESEPGSP